MWLVVFPEGTRFNPQKPEKIEKSQKFAESLGLPKLDQVLTPHTTGFEVIIHKVLIDRTNYYRQFLMLTEIFFKQYMM